MRRTMLVSGSIILISTLIAIEAHSVFSQPTKTSEEPGAGGWEYLVVQGGTVNLSPSDGRLRKAEDGFSREYFPLEKNMDKLGAKGWELVAVTGPAADPVYFFKRKK